MVVTNKKMVSFLKNLWKKKVNHEIISPKEAQKIQKEDYFKAQNQSVKSLTPPYLSIAENLTSDQKKVFEATLHYLYTIAKNFPKYRKDIIQILKDFIEKHKKDSSKIKQIKKYLSDLNTETIKCILRLIYIFT